MRHLIDPLDFSPEEIDSLLNLADRIRSDPAAYQDVAAHKKTRHPVLRAVHPHPPLLRGGHAEPRRTRAGFSERERFQRFQG